jgi:polyferredoxin
LRNLVYFGLWSAFGIALVVALFIRSDFSASVTPDRNPRFVTLSDGTIRNAYELKVNNQTGEDRAYRVSIKAEEPLLLELEGTSELVMNVPADGTYHQRVYLFAKPEYDAASADTTPVRFWVEDATDGERTYEDTVFSGDAR